MNQTPLTRLAAEDDETRKKKGTVHMPAEILQQPALWRETAAKVTGMTPRLRAFFQGAEFIVITGAGSSLHAGRLMEASARTSLGSAVSVVSCTDLMLVPEWYIPKKKKGVLISLSRSGESPESVEAAKVVAEVARDVAQVAVTCNISGALTRFVETRKNGICVFLPEKSYDKAMGTTSSVTCTAVAGRYLAGLVSPAEGEAYVARTEVLAQTAEALLAEHAATAEALAGAEPARVAVLGSLPFEAAAQEFAHKVLELTDGQVVATSRNFLEFRHGPIAYVDRSTTVFCLASSMSPLSKYEFDFISQLHASGAAREVVVLGTETPEEYKGHADRVIPFPKGKCNLGERAILSLVFGQIFSFFLSLRRGLTPDRPGNRGLVNPVVKGVTIYPRKEKS